MRRVFLMSTVLLVSAPALADTPLERIQVGYEDFEQALTQWHYGSVTTGGVARISNRLGDTTGGLGSLQHSLPSQPSASSLIELYSEDVQPYDDTGIRASHGGFGQLRALRELSFEWFRRSTSTASGHFTPAFRLIVRDPDVGTHGAVYALVWEGVYNGYANPPGRAVATNSWIHSNITHDKFWRVPIMVDGFWQPADWCAKHRDQCYAYDRGLFDWGFGPDTEILGLSISLGPGWNGSYEGHIDLVTLDVDDGARHLWDFESSKR